MFRPSCVLHSRWTYVVTGIVIAVVIGLFRLTTHVPRTFSSCNTAIQKKACWANMIMTMMKADGFLSTWGVIRKTASEDREFQHYCHDMMHLVGLSLYNELSSGKIIRLPKDASLCSYGVYHGFMETLIGKHGSITLARSLCDELDSGGLPGHEGLLLSCYHGIGHGAVVLHESDAHTNPWDLVKPGIALCEELVTTEIKLQNCVNGVIDGLASQFVSGQFAVTDSMRTDPLSLCRTISPHYKHACYTGLDWFMLYLADNNFPLAAQKYIEPIEEDEYATSSIHELASLAVSMFQKNYDVPESLALCRSLQPRLHISCIKGFADGIFQHAGKPGEEYLGTLDYCKNQKLEDDEKTSCYEELWRDMKDFYSESQRTLFCRKMGTPSLNKACVAGI